MSFQQIKNFIGQDFIVSSVPDNWHKIEKRHEKMARRQRSPHGMQQLKKKKNYIRWAMNLTEHHDTSTLGWNKRCKHPIVQARGSRCEICWMGHGTSMGEKSIRAKRTKSHEGRRHGWWRWEIFKWAFWVLVGPSVCCSCMARALDDRRCIMTRDDGRRVEINWSFRPGWSTEANGPAKADHAKLNLNYKMRKMIKRKLIYYIELINLRGWVASFATGIDWSRSMYSPGSCSIRKYVQGFLPF